MPTLTLRLQKRRDADALLILQRDDGTFTSAPIGRERGYGPVHDLAHAVVERAFGLREGFLGLIASGWTIDDFEVRGSASQLPDEAVFAEVVAGELSRQEMMGQYSSPDEFRWAIESWMAMNRPAFRPPTISSKQHSAMRDELSSLRLEWSAVPVGDALELPLVTISPSSVPRPARTPLQQ